MIYFSKGIKKLFEFTEIVQHVFWETLNPDSNGEANAW